MIASSHMWSIIHRPNERTAESLRGLKLYAFIDVLFDMIEVYCHLIFKRNVESVSAILRQSREHQLSLPERYTCNNNNLGITFWSKCFLHCSYSKIRCILFFLYSRAGASLFPVYHHLIPKSPSLTGLIWHSLASLEQRAFHNKDH